MIIVSPSQFHVFLPWGLNSVLNVKALVVAFNQEKALVGAFSVIVKPVVEPTDRFTALATNHRIAMQQLAIESSSSTHPPVAPRL